MCFNNLLFQDSRCSSSIHNKNLRFFDYKAGEKVWLKMKHYKSGENRKLSPRQSGPWTVMEKLPNGVNFCIVNDSTKNEKIVHHDRPTHVKKIGF